jgi:hypothetical protein
MIRFILALTSRYSAAALAVGLVSPLLAQQAAKAGSTTCTDLPISWTIYTTEPLISPAISSDNGQPYGIGSGFSDAVIHRCYGTYDATIVFKSSTRRYVNVTVPEPILNSVLNPPAPGIAGTAFETQPGLINVRNVQIAPQLKQAPLINSSSGTMDFYTRMVMRFPAPDGNTYALTFHPDDYTCPGDITTPCALDLDPPPFTPLNTPEEESWVKVHFIPASKSPTGTAQWIVYGEQPIANTSPTAYQLGSLFLGTSTQKGQYAMPFQILITALGPL